VKSFLSAFCVGIMLFCVNGFANATVLSFDNMGLPNYGAISQSYGDNVNALSDGVGSYGMGNAFTANVSVEYRSLNSDGSLYSNQMEYWQSGYNSLTNVAYADTDGLFAEISLVAESGYSVTLNSFDLGGWPQANVANQTVQILDGDNNILVDYSPVDIMGVSGHSSFSPNMMSEVIKIRFGTDWDVGIDNINFDQVSNSSNPVPEPATMFLLGGGLLGMLGIKRKKTEEV